MFPPICSLQHEPVWKMTNNMKMYKCSIDKDITTILQMER